MHRFIKVTCVCSFMMMTGCSSGYLVQYDSTPQSAMVVCNGSQKGFTPLNLYYPKSAIDGIGYLHTEECKAVWASGASAAFARHIPTTSYPDGIKYTVERPGTNGYSIDASADYQKKMNDQQRLDQNLKNFDESMKSMRQKQTYCNQIGTQVICNSY